MRRLFAAVVALGIATLTLEAAEAPPVPAEGVGDAASAGAISRWAHDLRLEQRYEEARRLCEAWLKAHPGDGQVLYELAYTVSFQGAVEGGSARGDDLRKRALQLAKESQKAGYSHPVLDMLLRGIDENGKDLGQAAFQSPVAGVAEALKSGEQAFSQGKLDAALGYYEQAFKLDPRSYPAALFAGDTHFSRKEYDVAIQWFERAIRIDPNRETAHRYWGDALARQGRNEEALDHYIEAVLAEPYNRTPREMIKAFSPQSSILRQPPMTMPFAEVTIKDGKPQIGYNPTDGELALAYAVARAAWLTSDRPRYFASDATARHSLPEELSGIRKFVLTARELGAKDATRIAKWEPWTTRVESLDAAGLLEPYVLLERADAGISKDYPAYREQHRDLLVRYIRQIWFGLK